MKAKFNILTLIIFLAASTNVHAAEKTLPIVSVETVKVEAVSPSVWVTGDVVNQKIAQISAEQNGRLNWVLEMGDSVKKGEPIAKIDARHLELQLSEFRSELNQQKANTTFLKKQKKRLALLVKNRSTAQTEFDRILRDLQISKEREVVLNQRINQTQLSIEKSVLKAPFSGLVNRRLANPGEFVTPGTPLVQFVAPSKIDVRISAPLDVAPFLKKNTPIEVKWNGEVISMPVRTWSPAGDPNSRTFQIRLDASGSNIMSGSAVLAALPSQLPEQATLVPRDALLLRQNLTYVVALDEHKKATRVNVTTGHGTGSWVSVNGEISDGDTVVIRGAERLKDGDQVRVELLPQKLAATAVPPEN